MHIINLRLVEIVFQHFFARMQRSFLELQTVPVGQVLSKNWAATNTWKTFLARLLLKQEEMDLEAIDRKLEM